MIPEHSNTFVPPSYNKTEEVEISICEWLQMQAPNFNHRRIFKLVQRWDKSIDVLGVCAEKQLKLQCNK
jgi:hypothetical protein